WEGVVDPAGDEQIVAGGNLLPPDLAEGVAEHAGQGFLKRLGPDVRGFGKDQIELESRCATLVEIEIQLAVGGHGGGGRVVFVLRGWGWGCEQAEQRDGQNVAEEGRA